MMKLIVLVLLITFGNFTAADEASVAVNCKEGFRMFTLSNNARFDICPVEDGNLDVDILSVGGSYHTCWWNAKAVKDGDRFVASGKDCSLRFTIKNGILNAKFTGGCRYYCGMRAGFRNGNYKQKDLTPSSKKQ